MFSNDNSLKILILLSQQEKPICAAEVAKILDIHISTAKRYLDLFTDFQFIKKEFVPTKPGKPTYYTSKRKEINISLNMVNLAKTFQNQTTKSSLPNPIIREKANLQPRVTYVLGEGGLVQSIVHVKRTKARRYVRQRIELSKNESRFMKYLPHPTMQAKSFIDICKKAKITDFYDFESSNLSNMAETRAVIDMFLEYWNAKIVSDQIDDLTFYAKYGINSVTDYFTSRNLEVPPTYYHEKFIHNGVYRIYRIKLRVSIKTWRGLLLNVKSQTENLNVFKALLIDQLEFCTGEFGRKYCAGFNIEVKFV